MRASEFKTSKINGVLADINPPPPPTILFDHFWTIYCLL